MNMWPFSKKYKEGYTGVDVLITNKMGSNDMKSVYDIGSGPFIYSFCFSGEGDDVMFMAADGGFINTEYTDGIQSCNGDAIKWQEHGHNTGQLKFKEVSSDEGGKSG
jgi:hypothetical protein